MGLIYVRTKDIEVNLNGLKIEYSIEPGKVLVLILDGNQGKAKICEAVEHGFTIVETVRGQAKRIKFEESELL
ncbi:XtrA/YqaO family protein [Bacillus thuringiensis]|uniref:XtrA/YqaO family protein n=2 Tax=Bacillus thuringiensis TaxID=1428 RepID=A0AAW9GGN8_BACTU|nr:XtrA/YqaO family protein [Bacillus thuringiensis]MDY0854058.1 XtrA/YqaO family protein [Bacillus thuringiensis]